MPMSYCLLLRVVLDKLLYHSSTHLIYFMVHLLFYLAAMASNMVVLKVLSRLGLSSI